MNSLLLLICILSCICTVNCLRKDSWVPEPASQGNKGKKRIGREDESFIQKIQPAAKPPSFKKKSDESKKEKYDDESEANLEEILKKPLPPVVKKSEDETYNYIYDLVKDKGNCKLPLREYYLVLAIISIFVFWRTYPIQKFVLLFYRRAVEPTKFPFDKNSLDRAV